MKLIKRLALAVLALAVSPAWADSWTFEKVNDTMTGSVMCQAVSPAQYMRVGPGSDLAPVRLVVNVQGQMVFLFVRLDTNKSVLHADVEGTGVKSDPGKFHPLTARVSQQVATLVSPTAAIDELMAAKQFRMRLRFWPYDRLVDSDPVTTQGMPAAVVKATKCA